MVMAFSALAGFGYFIYVTKPERPVAKRSYPYGGLAQELGGFSETPKVSVTPTGWRFTLILISSSG
jgi:hypothetical protein